jgi:hypothetical protein
MDPNFERIERLLALILLHDLRDAPQGDKAKALSRAAFSNSEIAALLGTTPGSIGQLLYTARQKRSTKKKSNKRSRK